MENVYFKSKNEMTNQEAWLKARRNGIGGSDAAAVLGLNRYKTNVQLWEEKTGMREPEDISDKSYVQYGIQAESLLRELFQLDYPMYKVTYDQYGMIANLKGYPFLFATLDGELQDNAGRRGILEIKTTEIRNSMQSSWWEGKVPDNYYVQIIHQLLVTGYDFAILKAQIKYDFDNEIKLVTKHYYFNRNNVLEDIQYLFQKEIAFWKCVTEKRCPHLILPNI